MTLAEIRKKYNEIETPHEVSYANFFTLKVTPQGTLVINKYSNQLSLEPHELERLLEYIKTNNLVGEVHE